jgi:hypothetical protein
LSKEEFQTALESLREELNSGKFINTGVDSIFSSYYTQDTHGKLKMLKQCIDNYTNDEALDIISKLLKELRN